MADSDVGKVPPEWLLDRFPVKPSGAPSLKWTERHREASEPIDLWCINLNDSNLDARLDILSEDEQQRMNKFAFAQGRNSFARSRCALRLILSDCLSHPAGEIKFNYNEHGRPQLATPALSNIQFNLSHSKDMALIALAKGRQVGVDINYLGQTREWQPIARRSFSEAEQHSLFALAESCQDEMFYRTWSQKEAYTKAMGDGFSYGFSKFSVVVDSSGAAGLLADDKHPDSVDEWTIATIDAGEGHVAALAYDGPAAVEIRGWKFCCDKW